MSTEGGTETRVRSCATCPSFLKPHEAAEFFGRDTGMAHCARFGHILGMPEMHERQAKGLHEYRAKDCNAYQMPRPTFVAWANVAPSATLPSREAFALEQAREDPETSDSLFSCRDCLFWSPEGAEELGMRGGAICGARNEFIFNHQESDKAQGCSSAMQNGSRYNVRRLRGGFQLLPVLKDHFYKPMTPFQRWKAAKENFVDPTEYPTDREVTAEDSERGIRAWREIIDHDSTNSVYLPVYDIERLPKELQELVPRTGDDEHPENFIDYDNLIYMLAAMWYELDETPALWGKPGTGKTEILRVMAWLMCLPFHRISVTASTELEEIIGQFVLRDNATEFVHGRLPRAWRSPGVICLDEPNVGPPEVWQAIRPLTDNSKQFVIDKNGGEVISRHPDSFLGLAMNPPWDTRNIGADLIADADSSRLAHLAVNYPPPEIEREIMREWADADVDPEDRISDETLDQIVQIAGLLRHMADDGTLGISWGVRHNIKVAKAARLFSLPKAYMVAAGNFLDPSQREALRAVVVANVN